MRISVAVFVALALFAALSGALADRGIHDAAHQIEKNKADLRTLEKHLHRQLGTKPEQQQQEQQEQGADDEEDEPSEEEEMAEAEKQVKKLRMRKDLWNDMYRPKDLPASSCCDADPCHKEKPRCPEHPSCPHHDKCMTSDDLAAEMEMIAKMEGEEKADEEKKSEEEMHEETKKAAAEFKRELMAEMHPLVKKMPKAKKTVPESCKELNRIEQRQMAARADRAKIMKAAFEGRTTMPNEAEEEMIAATMSGDERSSCAKKTHGKCLREAAMSPGERSARMQQFEDDASREALFAQRDCLNDRMTQHMEHLDEVSKVAAVVKDEFEGLESKKRLVRAQLLGAQMRLQKLDNNDELEMAKVRDDHLAQLQEAFDADQEQREMHRRRRQADMMHAKEVMAAERKELQAEAKAALEEAHEEVAKKAMEKRQMMLRLKLEAAAEHLAALRASKRKHDDEVIAAAHEQMEKLQHRMQVWTSMYKKQPEQHEQQHEQQPPHNSIKAKEVNHPLYPEQQQQQQKQKKPDFTAPKIVDELSEADGRHVASPIPVEEKSITPDIVGEEGAEKEEPQQDARVEQHGQEQQQQQHNNSQPQVHVTIKVAGDGKGGEQQQETKSEQQSSSSSSSSSSEAASSESSSSSSAEQQQESGEQQPQQQQEQSGEQGAASQEQQAGSNSDDLGDF